MFKKQLTIFFLLSVSFPCMMGFSLRFVSSRALKEDSSCEPSDDEQGHFYSGEPPCSQYYYWCSPEGGSPYYLECPPGSVFDPERPKGPACIDPDYAYCNGYTDGPSTDETSMTTTPTTPITETTETTETTTKTSTPSTEMTTQTTSTTDKTETTSSTPSSTTTSSTTTSSGNSPTPGNFTCPETTGSPLNNNYPYAVCSAYYYTCSNGVPYLLECPGDLIFNPQLGVCDYPSNIPECKPFRQLRIQNNYVKQPERMNPTLN